jgi:predicted transcriptional regulator
MGKQISKSYALQALHSYAEVVDNIPQLIKSSGYRVEYIADRLQIPRSTFYSKRRDKSFSYRELMKMILLINDDDEITPEENKYLLQLAHERRNDKKISRKKVMEILDA